MTIKGPTVSLDLIIAIPTETRDRIRAVAEQKGCTFEEEIANRLKASVRFFDLLAAERAINEQLIARLNAIVRH